MASILFEQLTSSIVPNDRPVRVFVKREKDERIRVSESSYQLVKRTAVSRSGVNGGKWRLEVD